MTSARITDSIFTHICIDRHLPGDSPYERRRRGLLAKAAGERIKMWQPAGRTLHVRFLDGDDTVQERVAKLAQQWSQYANLKFVFDNLPDAQLRISFKEAGFWALIGTDALDPRVAPTAPTINFGGMSKAMPNDQMQRVVMHEFGHVLGLIHEHQNPSTKIPWNKPAIYAFYAGPPNFWKKAEVDANLFRVYNKKTTQFTKFDPHSIMLYPIPHEFTLGGYSVGLNSVPSPTDMDFVRMWYPF